MSKVLTEKSWPAAKVEMRSLESILPYQHNPRTHPPAQIELLAASMKEDGVTAPIMVDEDGVILYGHGRLLAAKKNGFKKFPVIVAAGLSEDRKRAIRIKDNQIALLSGWDNELVKFEIESLKRTGYDVALLGFGEAQLVQFMTTPQPPSSFPQFDEDIPTAYCCPNCRYSWSGNPLAGAPDEEKNGDVRMQLRGGTHARPKGSEKEVSTRAQLARKKEAGKSEAGKSKPSNGKVARPPAT